MKPYRPTLSLEKTILGKLNGETNPFLSIWLFLFASIAMAAMSFVPQIRETMSHAIAAQIVLLLVCIGLVIFLVESKREYLRTITFLHKLLSEIRYCERLMLGMKGNSAKHDYWRCRNTLLFTEVPFWEYTLLENLYRTYEKETGKKLKTYDKRHDITVNGKIEFYWFALGKFKGATTLKDIQSICLQ